MRHVALLSAFSLGLALAACSRSSAAPAERPAAAWAIAIHGGAGGSPSTPTPESEKLRRDGLTRALRRGADILAAGGTSLDAVEAAVVILEDDPVFNAGRGAVFNHAGGHELDASIMNGKTLACGAVAGVSTVKNPIQLARKVMTETRHVLLAGQGAEAFAREQEFEPVPNDYFSTDERRQQWKRRREADAKGTVGAVALDAHGNLAAATSTGGLTDKRFGRVGDSPIIGAGTYADNRTVAVSGTGIGEEFIRHSAAHTVSALMQHTGISLEQAAKRVVDDTLKPGDGGVIAVSHTGEIVWRYNTPTMLRGAADAGGRFEVRVWD